MGSYNLQGILRGNDNITITKLALFSILFFSLFTPHVLGISMYQLNGTGVNETIVVFNGSGTTAWQCPGDVQSVWVLVVAGGGAGGSNFYSGSAGGGAGGLINETITVSPYYTYTITVGEGGIGYSQSGNDSSFGSLLAAGGGGGGGSLGGGKDGGSGGGGTTTLGDGNAVNASYGTDGGQGSWTSYVSGGGGGGAGGSGHSGETYCDGSYRYLTGGCGGLSKLINITGFNTQYAGGGGGYGHNGGGEGAGGGCAVGGCGGSPGSNGLVDTGSGGGANGGNGASGIVVLRYTTGEVIPAPLIASFVANITSGAPPLTVMFNDTSIGNPLAWNWSFADGSPSEDTQNVTHAFTSAGNYRVRMAVMNATAHIEYAYMNITVSQEISMQQVSYVTPHKVRFVCKDYLGAPITNMTVSTVGVETTLGSIDWVASIFGINLNTTPITNTVMTGTTDNTGSLTFLMLETEKYELHFTSPEHGINETQYYYPKEDSYNIIFYTETTPEYATASFAVINATLWNASANATYESVGLAYNDSLNSTDWLVFAVWDQNNTIINTTTYTTGLKTLNVSYPVLKINDVIYYWGVTANSTNYKNKLNITQSRSFGTQRWKADFLLASAPGASADLQNTAATVYNMIAVAMITIFALLFGRASIKMGVVIVPLFGMLFVWMGWLETPWLLVFTGAVLGVLFYLRFAEEESAT